jgi:hypothetical protein
MIHAIAVPVSLILLIGALGIIAASITDGWDDLVRALRGPR